MCTPGLNCTWKAERRKWPLKRERHDYFFIVHKTLVRGPLSLAVTLLTLVIHSQHSEVPSLLQSGCAPPWTGQYGLNNEHRQEMDLGCLAYIDVHQAKNSGDQ